MFHRLMTSDYTDVIGEMRGMVARVEDIRSRYANTTTYADRHNALSRVTSSLRAAVRDMEEERT